MKIKTQLPKCVGCSKVSFKGEFDSNKCLLEEQRKISNNLTLYLKKVEKKEQKKPNISRRKEIKIRAKYILKINQ